MEINTVNRKKKPEYILGAAGFKDPTITTEIEFRNNHPYKLQIEEANNGKKEVLPFMIENGELVTENGKYVATKAKDASREEFETMRAEAEKAKSGEDR